MEDVIDTLLKDFEAGKMTRRQLVKSLSLAVMAPAATSANAAQSIPPARDPAPWKTVSLDHISYSVSDYRKSAAFYRDLMGWEIKDDNGRNQCSMKIGSVGGIIVRNNQGLRSGAQSAPRDKPPRITGVIDHVSWVIEPWNTDSVKAELERRGLKPRLDVVDEHFKSFHVKDPDGWDLQISNQRVAREL